MAATNAESNGNAASSTGDSSPNDAITDLEPRLSEEAENAVVGGGGVHIREVVIEVWRPGGDPPPPPPPPPPK